jgi:hypothetical protein
MKRALWLANCAMGLAAVLLGPAVEKAHARGGREGGGFSRESPAATGGFSSHAGSAQGRQGSAQWSRQQTPSSMQSSHQQYASGAQASREQTATGMQSSRQQTATGMQSSAQQYHGSYPNVASSYSAWDAGAGSVAAATTGAVIGAAAVASASSHPAPVYVASPPCAAPAVIPVGSVKYFQCGSSWYTQGYGPNGPTLVAVPPPPGF